MAELRDPWAVRAAGRDGRLRGGQRLPDDHDCTEPNYDACCTFTQDGGSFSFCFKKQEAQIGGGTCM